MEGDLFARGWGVSEHTEEVVTVKMDWVGNRGDASRLLDEPVVPRAGLDGWHQVDLLWVAGVAFHQVRHGRLLPVNADRGVQRPHDDSVTIRHDDCLGKVDVHALDLGLEVAAGHLLVPEGDQGTRRVAGSGLGEPRAELAMISMVKSSNSS